MPDKSSNSHPINRARGQLRLAGFLIALCAGLILTFVGVLAMRSTEQREAQLEFDKLSEAVTKDLEIHLSTFMVLVRATVGMIEASDTVTRDEWLTYVRKIDPQEDLPGFRGLVLALVSKGDNEKLRVPLRLIAPSNPRNDALVGFDFMSDPVRAQAVLAARDSGEPVFTAPVILWNDAGQQEVSVVLMAPVYKQEPVNSITDRRAAFAGMVVTGLGFRAVVKHVFEVISQRGMLLHITDLDSGKAVFEGDKPGVAEVRHSHTATLQMGGRNWLLQFVSTPQFDEHIDRGRSRLMAVIGLLATLLLAGTAYQQGRMRRQAERRAQEMTRELRVNERELQLHLTRFSDLAELSADWFWEQDAALRFSRFWGAEGSNKDKFLGMHRWDMPIDLTPAQWEGHKAALAARQTFRNFEYPVHLDGNTCWYSINGKPLYDDAGKFVGYRGTGTDITVRKQLESELLDHRDHLQEMVAAQTADLKRAKETAECANQAKTEFLTNMSHELRTPLHAVLAFARLGHMRAGKAEVEKLQEYFELIRNSGNHLLELVDDLLDLSKLETGNARLAFASINLQERASAVVAELSALLEARHLACRVIDNVPGARVHGDQKRIDQLLRNLIGNAIKFSPAGGTILIELAPDSLPTGRRQGDVGERESLRMTVMDEGIGIPPDELETIFDKFIQSTLTADGSGGTGLGLAICREIIKAHRGIIRARNRPEGGAAFEVLLPLVSQDRP